MIVTVHQPDLLPYTGFWHKMVHSDLFVLAVHDQFQKHGYQRRVTMREKWCSHQLVGKPSLIPLKQVQVAPGWQRRLRDVIYGRYVGSRHWKARGSDLLDRIAGQEAQCLDEVNIALIDIMRNLLGITTPLRVQAVAPSETGVERVIQQVKSEGGDEYLAGTGGAAYMGVDPERLFASKGIKLSWSRHEPTSPDSILTALFDDDDPMQAVLRQRDGA